jgi:hypothetical protein
MCHNPIGPARAHPSAAHHRVALVSLAFNTLAGARHLPASHPPGSPSLRDSSEWDWLRGALPTVDRDYGILSGLPQHNRYACDTPLVPHHTSLPRHGGHQAYPADPR